MPAMSQCIAVGAEFQSYSAFEDALKVYERKVLANYVKQRSQLLKPSPTISAETVAKLQVSRVNFICKFGGKFKSHGEGVRKTSSFKEECPSHITLRCQYKTSSLKVTAFVEAHTDHDRSDEGFC